MCLALIVSWLIGLGIEALVAWGIAAVWALPFWPVFITVFAVVALLGLVAK